MSRNFVITGTDTDIGKTVFAAALTAALDAHYWKPVQAGLDGETDSEAVARLGGIASGNILPETFRLKTPASPHFAAAKDGVMISADDLPIPQIDGPLVIEGAGGALVPINDNLLYADLFALWKCPTIIVASTKLGTINHSLMTIEALRSRHVPILGVAFIGDEIADSQNTICRIGDVKQLGRLPIIENLSAASLIAAFHAHFSVPDFS
ncbi:dethiobiotin synthase [Parasphingorhabdus litoris]|uniref:ATP-dependent dethiobiotin synthetase BioD n=1 Tax=Parasphingorhabdus litoris TaxID=394733 RepID=A0ABN1AGU1_9SPHN|nr:dethiobiotin synthase [Parasphingorhabdus litoris]